MSTLTNFIHTAQCGSNTSSSNVFLTNGANWGGILSHSITSSDTACKSCWLGNVTKSFLPILVHKGLPSCHFKSHFHPRDDKQYIFLLLTGMTPIVSQFSLLGDKSGIDSVIPCQIKPLVPSVGMTVIPHS